MLDRMRGRRADAPRLRLVEPDEAVPEVPPMTEEPSEDAEDWAALRTGDQAAFSALFRRHQRLVHNFCFRRLGSWSQAEDATQAVFTAVWRRAVEGTVTPLTGDSARPVLVTMAAQECQTVLRSSSRRGRLVGRLSLVRAGSVDPREAPRDVDDWVNSEHTMRAIHASLRELPNNQREVIELVCWAELSVAEAAAALGVAEGTVKSRLHRARQALADSPAAQLLKSGGES